MGLPAAPVPTLLRVLGHPSGVFGTQRETCQENGGCEARLEFVQLRFEGNYILSRTCAKFSGLQ